MFNFWAEKATFKTDTAWTHEPHKCHCALLYITVVLRVDTDYLQYFPLFPRTSQVLSQSPPLHPFVSGLNGRPSFGSGGRTLEDLHWTYLTRHKKHKEGESPPLLKHRGVGLGPFGNLQVKLQMCSCLNCDNTWTFWVCSCSELKKKK